MPDILWSCADHIKGRHTLPDGATLRDAARLLCGQDEFRAPTMALVGGKPVLRSSGGWEQPLHGGVVIFVELPLGGGGGGGGSNPISIIFSVVAIALMAWNPGALLAGSSLLGLTGSAASFAGALFNGVLVAGLGMLAGALAGTPKLPQGQSGAMNASAASPTYNINSSGNQARLYQPEPEGFGKMLITPDYVAKTWAQYIGNDQYGYYVYAIGRGEYEIHSLQFGDTVFWRDGKAVPESGFDGVEVQICPPGTTVTLFPDNVFPSAEVAGQELFGPNEAEYSGPIGPYPANPPGTTTSRILLDIVLPQGLGRYNNEGNLEGCGVSWRFECRKIDDYGQELSGWSDLNTSGLSLATLTPQRLTLACDVPAARYEVRGMRTSHSAGDGRTMDTMQWMAMRAMLPGSLVYPQTVVAVKIKAQNNLSQSASSRFRALIARKLPLWDAGTRTWSKPVATRSWAAAMCAACKAQWGGRLTDDQLSLDDIWRIGARLDARNWHYDAYIDGAYNVWQLLTEMCQPALCLPRMDGTVFSVLEDGPNRPARYSLTPRVIRRGTFQITWNTWSEQSPDDVTVDYMDADHGYQQREVTATLPESESRESASLNMLGIVHRAHAFRTAVGYAARNRWRRVHVECEVEALGRRLNMGDVCLVSHPRLRDSASGIVTGWDADTLSLTLKKDAGVMTGENPYLSLTGPGGVVWGPVKILRGLLAPSDSPRQGVTPCTPIGGGDEGGWGESFPSAPSAVCAKRITDEESRDGAGVESQVAFDPEDYAALLLQGHSVPFDWLRRGERSLPTTWVLHTGREFSRRMLVQSVVPIDLWHSRVTLVNDDQRVWSYDDLPVPLWAWRGQLPSAEGLEAPQALNAWIEGTTENPDVAVLMASWLPVPGAEGYEVEIGADAGDWARYGRVTVNTIRVPVAELEQPVSPDVPEQQDAPTSTVRVRVAAVNATEHSAWTVWSGSVTPPVAKPEALQAARGLHD